MYKDIISYKLAAGITEDQLLLIAKRIVTEWMAQQPGFVKWEIHKDSQGGYTDIVYWESEAAAKQSEEKMTTIPNADEWYNCYEKDSIVSKKLYQVGNLS